MLQKLNMKIYTPVSVALRVIIYSLLMFGLAEAVRFDALFPMEEGYFGEISMVEILQEIILVVLFVFYVVFGFKFREIQPVANILSLFFLISFIREFNFLIEFWIYPALLVLAVIVWLVVRDFKKLKPATQIFFSYPASAWFFSGFLVTYIFSRLFGRSKFWLLIYDESNYRLAKAATEEGIELLGDALMLIGAIELIFVLLALKKEERK
jgi:hypothetical protein